MRSKLIAIAAFVSGAITAAVPACGHENHWNGGGGWNGGHHHGGSWNGHHGGSWRWNGSNWIWGAPLLGAAIAGAALASPYYAYGGYRYGGYGYVPYYSYPTPLIQPLPRWCPGLYGGWFLC